MQPPRFRFSLLALFLAMTAICLGLAWWVQPRRYIVESLFQVSAVPPGFLESNEFDRREFEVLLNTQRNLVRSEFVILAALRQPGIAALPAVASKEDPVAWIRERLNFDASADSEVFSIQLHCLEHETNDLTQVMNALAAAYENEVVFESHQRDKIVRDALYSSYVKQRDDFTKLLEEKQKLGADDSQEVERKVLQFEIDASMELMREMKRRLQIHEVEAAAPSRIRPIQKAVSRPE